MIIMKRRKRKALLRSVATRKCPSRIRRRPKRLNQLINGSLRIIKVRLRVKKDER